MAWTAVIGGALGLGGALLNSKAQNKAADKAATATTAAADRSAEVIQRNYDLSAQALRPWQQSGLGANALLNDFYGVPQQQQRPQVMPNQMEGLGGFGGGFGGENFGDGFGSQFPGLNGLLGRFGQQGQQPQQFGVSTPQVNSRDAFRQFIDNSDYGFQFGEGANRVNSGYAGAGLIKSGAAMRGLEQFRQNLQQGYRGEWAGGVANQANAGLGAASAQAGVSQNLGNSLAGIYQNQGANQANAALAKTNGFGNALSLAGGALFGYGRPT